MRLSETLDSMARYYVNLHQGNTKEAITKSEIYRLIKSCKKLSSVLDVGLGKGNFTDMLAGYFDKVIALDASPEVIKVVSQGLKHRNNIEYVLSDVEKLDLSVKVDNIVLRHVLEHLNSPVSTLRNLRCIMSDESTIYITVPNAMSLHRQAGVKMGLLPSIDALNDNDIRFGHKKLYTLQSLLNEVNEAGFHIVHYGGTILKPLTVQQMDKMWSKELIEAYVDLGEDYPEISGEIYVIARVK